jgi:hypothetical protein
VELPVGRSPAGNQGHLPTSLAASNSDATAIASTVMGRRHSNRQSTEGNTSIETWQAERTLAEAEADAAEVKLPQSDARCPCGSGQFLLQAYLQVEDGRPTPGFVELESLTCPRCCREFEAVETEDGRVLRGELLGHVDLDD